LTARSLIVIRVYNSIIIIQNDTKILTSLPQVKYWRAMEGHASRDLLAERLMSRRLSEEIESIVTGAHTDTSTIAGLRRTQQQLQQQVANLQLALEQQREDALRKEQQLLSDYKRALKLNASGDPRYAVSCARLESTSHPGLAQVLAVGCGAV
jgi:hypothetical protein